MSRLSTRSPRIRLHPLKPPKVGVLPWDFSPTQSKVVSSLPPPSQSELCPLGPPRTQPYLLRIPKVDHVLSELPNFTKHMYSTFFN